MNKLIKIVLVKLLLFVSIQATAQTILPSAFPATPSDLQQFSVWVGQQKAYAGIAYFIEHDNAKYADTWLDLVQFGGKGFNVAQPSNTLDWFDIGPAMAAANGRQTRWGVTLPIHGGNIWNALPKNSRVNTTPLPPFIIAPQFMFPANGVIGKWRWDDFMVAFAFGFGGS